MKRPLAMLLSIVLTLTLLAACGKQEGGIASPDAQVSKPSFTRDDLPRLDGSTSTVPLALAVCAEVLGESREETLSASTRPRRPTSICSKATRIC